MSTFDIEKLRAETPGCQQVMHFNNAGASLPPRAVIEAVKQHIDLEASIGGYEAAVIAKDKIEKFYPMAAQLINCEADEIAFVENATRAWDMAFYSFNFKRGDRILTAEAEYVSNYLAFLHMAKRTGIVIDVINNDVSGQLDVTDLEAKIAADVKLIAITHVPTQGGLINPAAAVGRMAQQYKIPYLLDATQSVGQMPIDVKELGCDFLCATGRKYLRGPRGTGFLFASRKCVTTNEPPFLELQAANWIADNAYEIGSDAKRFETWEQYYAGKIGLSTAIEYALQLNMPVIWKRIQDLAMALRSKLAAIPAITLQDLGEKKCGIVTFTHKNKTAQEIQQQLAKHKINVSVSLQEYARLDLGKRHLPALVRASVHYYNTPEEIERLCEVIE